MAVRVNKVEVKEKVKVNRPGVHAKSKTSSNNKSKNYKKPKVGQG